MKKNKFLYGTLAVAALLMAACGNGDSPDAEETANGEVVEIDFFHRWPNEPRNSFYDQKIKEFEEMKDGKVKINVDKVLNDSYKEKIRVLVSNDDLPDVFTSWSDSFAENLVSSGRIRTMDDLYEEDAEWAGKIMESQIGGFTFDDQKYGVPFTIDGKAWFYNQAIFDEHGIEAPENYDELIDVLDELQAAGFETPIMEGLTDAWTISHYLGTIFDRLIDKETLDKDYDSSTGEFTDPRYVEGLEMFQQLTTYMGDTASAIDHETARNMFANGEVPMMYLQLAEIAIIEDVSDIEFGYFNFPEVVGADGDQTSLTGAPEGFMLSKDAPEEAIEFLKFLTSEETAFDFVKEVGAMTAIDGSVTADNASEQTLKAYDLILEASSSAPWFDNAVDINIADIFMRGGQSLALEQTTPTDLMVEVQTQAEAMRQ